MGLILQRVDWDQVSSEVKRQQRNREVYTPPISVFRWWARRSHSLIGALLDAAVQEFGTMEFIVSDPFSGGGTVGIEAAIRGLRLYAQDLQPWAILGLATVLDGVDPEELREKGTQLLNIMDRYRDKYYRTVCPRHGSSEVIHTFWVRRSQCNQCGHHIYLYSTPLITYAQRVERESGDLNGYFGCTCCGAVTRAPRTTENVRCRICASVVGKPSQQLIMKNLFVCPHCGKQLNAQKLTRRNSRWIPTLVQRLCRHDGQEVLHFDCPTEAEVLQATSVRYPKGLGALGERIPAGQEIRRLVGWGYRTWNQLYPPRQVACYLRAAEVLKRMEFKSEAARTRLQVMICGAAEMAGYASRWDRFHLKAFESIANHRFSAATCSAEVNPLGDRGRGTLRRRLAHMVKAASWIRDLRGSNAIAVLPLLLGEGEGLDSLPSTSVLVAASSERQLLQDQSVRLVVTDPPYFDDVQYGELARPFTAWARRLGVLPNHYPIDYSHEAVVNAWNLVDGEKYTHLLGAILKETRRTLRPDGHVIITYHNDLVDAWAGLGIALQRAGLRIAALSAVHSENETDHAKRGRNGFMKDLVLECCPGDGPNEPLVLCSQNDDETRELIAMGTALALNPGASSEVVSEAYERLVPEGIERKISLGRRKSHVSTKDPD